MQSQIGQLIRLVTGVHFVGHTQQRLNILRGVGQRANLRVFGAFRQQQHGNHRADRGQHHRRGVYIPRRFAPFFAAFLALLFALPLHPRHTGAGIARHQREHTGGDPQQRHQVVDIKAVDNDDPQQNAGANDHRPHLPDAAHAQKQEGGDQNVQNPLHQHDVRFGVVRRGGLEFIDPPARKSLDIGNHIAPMPGNEDAQCSQHQTGANRRRQNPFAAGTQRQHRDDHSGVNRHHPHFGMEAEQLVERQHRADSHRHAAQAVQQQLHPIAQGHRGTSSLVFSAFHRFSPPFRRSAISSGLGIAIIWIIVPSRSGRSSSLFSGCGMI